MAIHFPLHSHTPLYIPLHVGCGAGGRGAQEGAGEARRSEKCPPSLANSGASSAPSSRGGGHCKAPPLALHRGSAERAVARPSPPPAPRPPASPELSVAPTSPAGAAGPARASPRGPRPLSNPLGSRRLLREERLAAAGTRAARLRAGRRRRRRRGARYGEPSNEARAGAQRRRVLAERGRGAAAAVVVAAAAGAQGPLHHWQPWSPSIFVPRGRRSARHTSSGRKRAPAPGLLRRAAGRARERRGELASSSQPAGCLGTVLLPRPGGRGPRAAAAAAVAPFAVVAAAARRGWCSDCSRRRSKK